jgi:hypothetical protein
MGGALPRATVTTNFLIQSTETISNSSRPICFCGALFFNFYNCALYKFDLDTGLLTVALSVRFFCN